MKRSLRAFALLTISLVGTFAFGDTTPNRSAIAFKRTSPLPLEKAIPNYAIKSSSLYQNIVRAAYQHPSTVKTIETDGNRYQRMMFGGKELAQRMREMILSAKKEVFIGTYTIDESWMAAQVKEAIAELHRTRPEVPVYILANSFYPTKSGKLDFPITGGQQSARMKQYFGENGDKNVYAGIWRRRTVGPLFSLARIVGRNVFHSKMVVIDNERALITDGNLQRTVDPVNKAGYGWLQMGVQIEGPAAAAVREEQVSAWKRVTPKNVTLPPAPPAHKGFADGVPIVSLGQEAGSLRRSSLHGGYVAAFGAARQRIAGYIANLNDKDMVEALARATANCDVYLLVSKRFNQWMQSMPMAGGPNDKSIARLARMAANPKRLHIRWYPGPESTEGNAIAVEGNRHHANHAKPFTVDNALLVGSENLDNQSTRHSREYSQVIFDKGAVADHDREFRASWARAPKAHDLAPEVMP